ncbi:Helix-turn-helix of DDE superfamily endonuclease [Thermomonospora echinospora]|uniref:Helix-turn-helix of DDE superfamily endonuclease n=1 Tax=Thermomonospora echinospora TaxID=1992 RepID=A0A1H6AHZ5_9ACTN|nr:Helix-turn-helix of DDE superfamily endonuclease [Thermomonospora echinospora]
MERGDLGSCSINSVDARSVEWFTGLSLPEFMTLAATVRARTGDGADRGRTGRPWALSLVDRILLVACYYRSNASVRQLAVLFGVTHSAVGRTIKRLGPHLALQPVPHLRLRTSELLVTGRAGEVEAAPGHGRRKEQLRMVINVGTRLVLAADGPRVRDAGAREKCSPNETSGDCGS